MNKISNLELNVLSTYLLKSFFMINGINIIFNINKQDSIISVILSLIIGIIIIKIFDKNKFDLIKKTDESYSKLSSFLIKVILLICVTIFSSCLLYLSSMFIKSSLLNNVDILPTSVLYILCITYLTSKGITTICRSSFISFFIFLLFEILSLFFITPNINSLRILPLLTQSISNTLTSCLLFIVLSVFPIFLLGIIEDKYIKKTSKFYSSKLVYLITTLYILFNLILILSVIDIKLCILLDYPEIAILSKISALNFFDRMEDILSFKLLFDLFFTLSLSIYYINKIISSISKKNSKWTLLIISIILLFLSNYITFNILFLIVSLLIFGLINILLPIKFKE